MIQFPSGDPEIDALREEMATSPTTEKTAADRFLTLATWRHLLQRQGAATPETGQVLSIYGEIRREGIAAEDRLRLYEAIDAEYRALEQVQQSFTENPPKGVPSGEQPLPAAAAPTDWPMYAANPHHTASTEDPGPAAGLLAWRRPMGLAWYAKPVVEDGRVYATSPGMRTSLYCLDAESGAVIWKTRHRPTDYGEFYTIDTHTAHRAASTPVVVGSKIVINEIGGQGRDFAATDLLHINKADGSLIKRTPAGNLDYRIGTATLHGEGDLLVYAAGSQKIGEVPPQTMGTNRVICRTSNGDLLWDFYVGPLFGEPVLDGGRVYAGTADGTLFCLNVTVETSSGHVWGGAARGRVAWQYHAADAINSTPVVHGDHLYVGTNGGTVLCLDKLSGALIWKREVGPVESRAFQHFSAARVVGDRIYIGSANRRLSCLDASSGATVWEYEAEEWIRAAPAVADGVVVVALTDGTVEALRETDGSVRRVWKQKLGTHSILADLVEADGRVYATSSDLFLWCLDASDGSIQWRHSLMECVYRGDERIAADEVAAVAGGHFQSKPVAADGKVFYGTPARFVYGVDHRTGEELWRFEMGAAVSGSPSYSNGRVYVGQQGGEDYFYCLDANTGALIWRQSLGWVWSSATISDGKLFIPGVDGYVSCLDEKSGSILWRYRTGRAAHPEPPVDDGIVYFGSWDHYDYAIDINSGRVIWQYYTGGTPDSGAPIASDGKLYLPMGGDSFRCMDATTGEVIWEHREKGLSYNASPALHDGRIFMSVGVKSAGFPTETRIICLDAADGHEIWTHPGGGLTAPSVANGKVYFASSADPFFYCVDEKGNGDGTTTCYWKYRMGDRVYESVPPVYDGVAYICCRDGFFYAIA